MRAGTSGFWFGLVCVSPVSVGGNESLRFFSFRANPSSRLVVLFTFSVDIPLIKYSKNT
jgi:hypothetical protein